MPARALPAAPQARHRPGLRDDSVVRWLMPAPAVLLLAGFTIWLLIQIVRLSFATVKPGREPVWVGLANYERFLGDATFWIALRNTAVFTVSAVGLELALGMALALLLQGEVTRWRTTLRTLFLLPMVLSPVVVGITWRALLTPEFGWVNQLLGFHVGWLSHPDLALFTLIAVDAWQWTPFTFVILLAGLLGLPPDADEAARVDGANAWQRFRLVTLPMLAPLIAIVAVLRAIDASKVFDLVYNLTQGGPGTATETLAFYMYRLAFRSFDQGYAATISVVLSIIVGVLVAVFLKLGGPARVRR